MMARRRLWITIAAVAGGIILILLIAIPFLLNADNYRPRIQSHALRCHGTAGHARPSQLLALHRLTHRGPAQHRGRSRLQPAALRPGKQVHIGIEVGPLLFHKQILIRSITIDTPKISLIQNQANVWNYASLGNSSKRSNNAETQSSMPNLSIGVLEVKDGQVTITDSAQPRRRASFRTCRPRSATSR